MYSTACADGECRLKCLDASDCPDGLICSLFGQSAYKVCASKLTKQHSDNAPETQPLSAPLPEVPAPDPVPALPLAPDADKKPPELGTPPRPTSSMATARDWTSTLRNPYIIGGGVLSVFVLVMFIIVLSRMFGKKRVEETTNASCDAPPVMSEDNGGCHAVQTYQHFHGQVQVLPVKPPEYNEVIYGTAATGSSFGEKSPASQQHSSY